MANPYNIGTTSSGGATSFNISVGTSTSAGDVIVVNAWTGTAPVDVTDTQGNEYVLVNIDGTTSQWVSVGKTLKLTSGTDHLTVVQTSSADGNAIAVGVPGAWYGGVDATSSANATGTAISLATGGVTYNGPQVAIAMVASAASTPSWGGEFTSVTTSHGSSTEFIGAAYANILDDVTAIATVTSGAWVALTTTLIISPFTAGVPAPIPSQYAGELATSSDMNALAQASLWLRRPPMVIAQTNSSGTGQSMPSSGQAITFSTILRDTDGFFNPGSSSHLTVQTPGYYKVRYSVPFAVGSSNCQIWVRITTGSNNPAGSGVQSNWWYGWAGAGNSNDGCVIGGGVIPLPLYQGDYIQIFATPATTANMPVSPQPAIVSMRMVSTR